MSKKIKKIYKLSLKLTPKLTVNRKWTVWRSNESKIRKISSLNEIKKTVFHYLQKNTLQVRKASNNIIKKPLPYYHTVLQMKFDRQSKCASLSKPKNYCYYIGRSRSTNRKMFMARQTFRKFARFGMLPGFIKEKC